MEESGMHESCNDAVIFGALGIKLSEIEYKALLELQKQKLELEEMVMKREEEAVETGFSLLVHQTLLCWMMRIR
jgi:hypothetical protein